MTRLLRTLVILLPAAASESGSRHPPEARADILRIQAGSCAGDARDRVGTGFAWHSTKEVVTALHVVAGCQQLIVYSERDQRLYRARIVRVLRRADLALVQVDGDVNFPPITELVGQPPVDMDLTAWGYGEGTPAMRDFRRLRVANGPATLQQNIPAEVARDLTRAGSPALDLNVVPIDAPIAPGLSGAPLLDGTGRVRAIADGGVSHGITHVSWAIPVRYLADLVQSSESATALQGSSANLSAAEVTRAEVTRAQVFSADFVDPTVPTINCGSARLRKARTRTLAEAELGSDSPIALQQLKTMGLGGVPPDLPFDVYEDVVSGATIAVPAGVPLQPQGPSCRASIFGGQVELVVSVTGIPWGSNPDVISAQFELFAATPPPMSWMPDPGWSYLMPFYRPDGFIVRRKAFKRFVPNPYNLPTDYMFETLAARNGTFLGVAAIRHSDLQLQLCQRGVYPPQQCPNFEYMRAWAHVALSVQLSTFAISALNPNSTSWQQTDRGGR